MRNYFLFTSPLSTQINLSSIFNKKTLLLVANNFQNEVLLCLLVGNLCSIFILNIVLYVFDYFIILETYVVFTSFFWDVFAFVALYALANHNYISLCLEMPVDFSIAFSSHWSEMIRTSLVYLRRRKSFEYTNLNHLGTRTTLSRLTGFLNSSLSVECF